MAPSVSVILPVFNSEAFIAEAVTSVLQQDFADFELLVIDDGSTDSTPEILTLFTDERIKIIRTENRGVAAARNMGLDHAKGSVITFLDSDDRWRPSKLSTEDAMFSSEPEIGLIFSNFIRFSETGAFKSDQFTYYEGLSRIPSRKSRSGHGRVVTVPAFPAFLSLYDFPAWTSALAVRAEVIGDLRFPKEKKDQKGRLLFLEDLALAQRLFQRTCVAYIRKPMAEIRRHPDNSTADYSEMPQAILNTLLSLKDVPVNSLERVALRRRIARQWVAVGEQQALQGNLIGALRCFTMAALRGRPHSVAKRLLLLPRRIFFQERRN